MQVKYDFLATDVCMPHVQLYAYVYFAPQFFWCWRVVKLQSSRIRVAMLTGRDLPRPREETINNVNIVVRIGVVVWFVVFEIRPSEPLLCRLA